MHTNTTASSSEPGGVAYEELAQRLRMMLVHITTMEGLARAGGTGDEAASRHVLQGLQELAAMAGDLLLLLERASGALPLAALPDVSLSESLSQLVESTAETLGLSSRVTFTGHEYTVSDSLARLLYRIAQEALARISAHAGARRLRFTLDYRQRDIVMNIEDDGVPIDLEQPSPSATDYLFLFANQSAETGSDRLMDRLCTMVETIGGTCVTTSGVEQGVQVQVCVPLVPHYSAELAEPLPVPDLLSIPAQSPVKTTVLVVDGQAVSRAGLRRLLESYADLEIVGEAENSIQAVSETAELLPQIVLIDAQLPEHGAVATLRQLRELNAETRTLLLAGHEDEELLYEALRAGARGYVSKDVAPDELARAVRGVARGEVLLQPQLAARLLARSGSWGQSTTGTSPAESLTIREREVLQLLARGLRNKEIAARLVVSERTVNFHLANIYAKLHVSGRTEALSRALQWGLLSDLGKRTAM
jgi:DNA-binding NarL/FixJ family response regulator